MRRFLLAVAVALLTLDASGVPGNLLPEACAPLDSEAEHQTCPPMCARCNCCAQPVLQAQVEPSVSAALQVSPAAAFSIMFADDPRVREIPHIPKPAVS